MMMKRLTVLTLAATFALNGCVTDPVTGQQTISKTALFGLGGAAACGAVGALTHGSKGARNAALGCGVVGAGVGAYMDVQENRLRQELANTPVEVQRQGDQIKLTMPSGVTFATNSASLSPDAVNSLNTVGYKELFSFFDGTIPLEEAIRQIQSNTRRYMRKQLTWFKKDPEITWFHPDNIEEITNYIDTFVGITD